MSGMSAPMSGMASMPTSTSSSSSSMMSRMMVFTNDQTTPLYSSPWTPSTTGGYAGTCIFLIILAILGRFLLATKFILERRWLAAALNRRIITVAGKSSDVSMIEDNREAKRATLISAKGVEEPVKVLRRTWAGPQPWRLSVDVPRALLFLCISGVGYLLMLAVMTMNVGYFCSVLAGTFIGELAVGRLIDSIIH